MILVYYVAQSLNDGTPEVRDAAFSALAAVAKVLISGIFLSICRASHSTVPLTSLAVFFLLYQVGWHETSGKVVGETR